MIDLDGEPAVAAAQDVGQDVPQSTGLGRAGLGHAGIDGQLSVSGVEPELFARSFLAANVACACRVVPDEPTAQPGGDPASFQFGDIPCKLTATRGRDLFSVDQLRCHLVPLPRLCITSPRKMQCRRRSAVGGCARLHADGAP